MPTKKLEFVAKIEDIGPISCDGGRRQSIQLKNVAKMAGEFFTEADGFVKITIERLLEQPEKRN